jgi:hypothetical protein
VDIVLQTKVENPSLVFRSFKRFDDGSGYSVTLRIRSGWIGADYDFYFEEHRLREFIQVLEEVDRTLAGTARLKPTYENQFIQFRGDGQGHVIVEGELTDHGGMEQRVRFAFRTDQTCLRPLISELRHAIG